MARGENETMPASVGATPESAPGFGGPEVGELPGNDGTLRTQVEESGVGEAPAGGSGEEGASTSVASAASAHPSVPGESAAPARGASRASARAETPAPARGESPAPPPASARTESRSRAGAPLDILTGPVWKKMLLFVLPIMGGSLFQQLYYYVDAAVVGHAVGSAALGAVDSTQPLLGLFIDFFVGLATGATIVIAQYWGARDERHVSEAVHTAVAFAVVIGLLITLIGLPLAEPMLRLMNTPEETLPYALTFIRIQLVGVSFMMVYNMGASILRSVGDSRRPFYFLIACSLVNISLELLFVVVLGWGVAGAAWATVVAIATSAVLVMAALCRSREAYRVELRRVGFSGPMLRRVMGIGLPTGVQMSTFSVSNMIIQSGVNACGPQIVAAYAVCGKCNMVLWLVLDSFALGATTFMGQCYGAGDIPRAKCSVWVAVAQCYAFTLPMGALILLFAPQISGIFTSDVSLLPDTLMFLHLLLPGYFTFILAQMLTGAVRGTGETLRPMLIMLGGVCALRIVWMLVVVRIWPGALMVAMAYPVSWGATGLVSLLYYLRGGWRRRLDAVEARVARQREAAVA